MQNRNCSDDATAGSYQHCIQQWCCALCYSVHNWFFFCSLKFTGIVSSIVWIRSLSLQFHANEHLLCCALACLSRCITFFLFCSVTFVSATSFEMNDQSGRARAHTHVMHAFHTALNWMEMFLLIRSVCDRSDVCVCEIMRSVQQQRVMLMLMMTMTMVGGWVGIRKCLYSFHTQNSWWDLEPDHYNAVKVMLLSWNHRTQTHTHSRQSEPIIMWTYPYCGGISNLSLEQSEHTTSENNRRLRTNAAGSVFFTFYLFMLNIWI